MSLDKSYQESLKDFGAAPIVKGTIELLPDGFGFITPKEATGELGPRIYVSETLAKRFELKNGSVISGRVRPAKKGEAFAALLSVESVS